VSWPTRSTSTVASVAVSRERHPQPVEGPVLVGMPIEDLDEPPAVGMAELDRDIGRREPTFQKQRRTRMIAAISSP
jgi:hypothetical protein